MPSSVAVALLVAKVVSHAPVAMLPELLPRVRRQLGQEAVVDLVLLVAQTQMHNRLIKYYMT